MNLQLDGKVALITGATGGLGAACARELAQEGAKLFLTARTENALVELAESLREKGGDEVRWLATDLTSPEAARAVSTGASNAFGRVDVLVNSAGASAGRRVLGNSRFGLGRQHGAQVHGDCAHDSRGIAGHDRKALRADCYAGRQFRSRARSSHAAERCCKRRTAGRNRGSGAVKSPNTAWSSTP